MKAAMCMLEFRCGTKNGWEIFGSNHNILIDITTKLISQTVGLNRILSKATADWLRVALDSSEKNIINRFSSEISSDILYRETIKIKILELWNGEIGSINLIVYLYLVIIPILTV